MVTPSKARKYVALLALRFDNFKLGVEYVTLLALRLGNFHLWSDGRLYVCFLCRRREYWGGASPLRRALFLTLPRRALARAPPLPEPGSRPSPAVALVRAASGGALRAIPLVNVNRFLHQFALQINDL